MTVILANDINATQEPARPSVVPKGYVFVPHDAETLTPAGWRAPRSRISKITKRELVECAHRELSKRESFYPRLVLQGKLRQREADRETVLMQAIFRVLSNLSENAVERAQEC